MHISTDFVLESQSQIYSFDCIVIDRLDRDRWRLKL